MFMKAIPLTNVNFFLEDLIEKIISKDILNELVHEVNKPYERNLLNVIFVVNNFNIFLYIYT